MTISRRRFLHAAALSLGFAGLHRHLAWGSPAIESRFGPLVPAPEGVLDQPKEYSYQLLSRVGDPMADGLLVPGKADGMAAFPGPEGRTLLIRNHEVNPTEMAASPFGASNDLLKTIPAESLYDGGHGAAPHLGGTTTLVYKYS